LKRLAAHLEEAHGTLGRRGTPVEKHWSRGSGDVIKVKSCTKKMAFSQGHFDVLGAH